ncbi:hypothetical protein N8J89_07910 [Crossiella sp. CA-258035]|uniref:hypothetical protein n=1 Tax=Crossiella sp. CA-258035 TaxID=2981138 RepID=UPI0024BC74AD|nr:hypothetical protein [Crossiella sp. CA-258035]WHT20979.1 hypothetical protein N8J89_07910 [Crossiella sp. CA-258035]
MIDRSGCAAKKHGTVNAYSNFDCRCPDAREDYNLYERLRRRGQSHIQRVDGDEVQMRLRALGVMGHSLEDIAEEIGWFPTNLYTMRHGKHPQVLFRTYQTIYDVYLRRQHVFGGSTRTQRFSVRKGWLPPAAVNSIYRFLSGADVRLCSPEQQMVLSIAKARGVDLSPLIKRMYPNAVNLGKLRGAA